MRYSGPDGAGGGIKIVFSYQVEMESLRLPEIISYIKYSLFVLVNSPKLLGKAKIMIID